MGELAVILEFSRTVVDGSVFLIGISFVNQRLDHVNHAADLFCCQRVLCRRLDIHCVHVFLALSDIPLGYLIRCNALFNGFLDNLVVHICEIRDKVHIIASVFKITSDRVKYDHRTRVPDVNKIIYGRSAYIHFHLTLFQRYKFLFSF